METFATGVGAFVAGLVVLLCSTWWRRRRAAGHRADLERGGRVTMRARLALPGRGSRAGQIALAPGYATWTARWGDHRVHLAGAALLSTAVATGRSSGPDDVVLRMRPADGQVVLLTIDEHDAAVLADALHAAPARTAAEPPGPPRTGRRWWAWLLLALSGLWVAFCLCLYATGYSTTVTVVGGDGEGFCDVVWQDRGGVERSGEADCDDDPAGSRLDVRISGWPIPEDPSTPGLYVGIALTFAVPPALVGAVRLHVLRNRRKAWSVASPAPVRDAPAPTLPPLTAADLAPSPGEQPAALLARLAPYARRQVSPDGWEDTRRPDGARSPVQSTAVLTRLVWPLGLVVLVMAVLWPLPAQWYALTSGPTVVAEATSTGERAVESLGPLPEMVTVRFRDADGRTREADVAVDDRLPEGADVRVEYAAADASAARLLGDGGAFSRGVAVGAAGVLVGCLWFAAVLVLTWRRTRAVRAVSALDRRPVLGLLTADALGHPLVLAVDPLVLPIRFVAVPVQLPLPPGTCAHFLRSPAPTLSARGALRAGELVVLEVDGTTGRLVPGAPAAELPPEVLLDLLDSVGALTRAAGRDDLDRPHEGAPEPLGVP